MPEARFGDDLDADSLDLVELVMALEEAFDVTVDESELEGIETIGQAYESDLRQALMLLGVGPDGPVPGRRVAITGMGVVSCCGIGLDAFWDGLQQPAPEGERRVAGFDPTAWFGPKEVRRVDRFAQFSVAAADMALIDAGELGADPDRCRGDLRHRRRRPGDAAGTDRRLPREGPAARVARSSSP